MVNKMFKRAIIVFIMLIVILISHIAYTSYFNAAINNSTIVCGRFVGTTTIRGVGNVQIEFVSNGVKRSFYIYLSSLKENISIDSLLNIKCVEISCSVSDPDIFDITDRRFLNDSWK